MTIEEFEVRVKAGAKLVILDDMVLDVSQYQFNHPGGRFFIEQNIGRDISKFFYGGYILENYKGAIPYTHSNIARMVVNTLIISKLNTDCMTEQAHVIERE
jgi:cytochrome b involved in lipid metabolism